MCACVHVCVHVCVHDVCVHVCVSVCASVCLCHTLHTPPHTKLLYRAPSVFERLSVPVMNCCAMFAMFVVTLLCVVRYSQAPEKLSFCPK